MLRKITVKNFKCFDDLTFDLSAADYSYNPALVKDGIVNKSLVYGKNGTGKTSLGLAVFDVVLHLTDKQGFPPWFTEYYRNLSTGGGDPSFQYTFSFDFDEVVYEYEKRSATDLVRERLSMNGKTLLDYDYGDGGRRFVDKRLRGDLNIVLPDNRLSVVKYIYRNTPTGFSPVLTRLVQFCERMLWFRSLSDGNGYCGFTSGSSTLDRMLYESGELKRFQDFLGRNGLDYDLGFEDDGSGAQKLYAYFDGRRTKALFSTIASSGTRSLWLFFVWMAYGGDRLSLLFVDEFDAFYHYETAAAVVKELNGRRGFQSILTTHNTYLMQNQFTRPDCCFILTGKQVKSLKRSTERELREAHNLEKMYIGGAFSE